MSCEIRTKGGQLIGHLADSDDGEDYLLVDNKRVALSDVYNNEKLKNSFNDSVKSSNDLEDNQK